MKRVARALVTLSSLVAGISSSVSAQWMSPEVAPFTTIEGPPGEPDYTAIPNPEGGNTFIYAPPEVAIPHEKHCLTVFKPPGILAIERRPTIIHSPASVLQQTPAPPQNLQLGFLSSALQAGYVVIVVGSTGTGSTPTFYTNCTPSGNPSTCWDAGIVYPYEPDPNADSPWNDFNYFFGEKDFIWAIQFIKLQAQVNPALFLR